MKSIDISRYDMIKEIKKHIRSSRVKKYEYNHKLRESIVSFRQIPGIAMTSRDIMRNLYRRGYTLSRHWIDHEEFSMSISK